jgi:anti-anti-sigma factor
VEVPGLQITFVRQEGTVEIRLAGEVDIASVQVVEQALREAIATGAPWVVIDGTALSYLDSSGINCLVRGAADAEAEGVKLVVRNVTGIVRRVLEITDVDGILLEQPGHDRCGPGRVA